MGVDKGDKVSKRNNATYYYVQLDLDNTVPNLCNVFSQVLGSTEGTTTDLLHESRYPANVNNLRFALDSNHQVLEHLNRMSAIRKEL